MRCARRGELVSASIASHPHFPATLRSCGYPRTRGADPRCPCCCPRHRRLRTCCARAPRSLPRVATAHLRRAQCGWLWWCAHDACGFPGLGNKFCVHDSARSMYAARYHHQLRACVRARSSGAFHASPPHICGACSVDGCGERTRADFPDCVTNLRARLSPLHVRRTIFFKTKYVRHSHKPYTISKTVPLHAVFLH